MLLKPNTIKLGVFLFGAIFAVPNIPTFAEAAPIPSLCSDNSSEKSRDERSVSINACLRFTEQYPEDANGFFQLGLAYLRDRRSIAAVEALSRAIELQPNNAEAYYLRGKHSLGAGEAVYSKKVQDYSQAIKYDASHEMAYIERGNLLRLMGRYEEALHDFDKAIEINPGKALTYNQRASTYGHLDNKKAAIENYTKAIEIDPNFSAAFSNRGNVYRELGELEKALSDQSTSIEIEPDRDASFNNRARVLRDLSRFEEAIADHMKALELEKEFAEKFDIWSGYSRYMYELGITYKTAGDADEALKALTNASDLGNKDAQKELNGG